MLRSLVVKGADGASGVILFADWGSVAIPLAVTAAGGLVCGVSDFDFSFSGKKQDVGTHPLTILRGGGNDDGGGCFFSPGSGVRVQEASRGDFDVFGILDGSFKVYEEAFTVFWNVSHGEGVNCKLGFVRGGAEGEPGGVSDGKLLLRRAASALKKGE